MEGINFKAKNFLSVDDEIDKSDADVSDANDAEINDSDDAFSTFFDRRFNFRRFFLSTRPIPPSGKSSGKLMRQNSSCSDIQKLLGNYFANFLPKRRF